MHARAPGKYRKLKCAVASDGSTLPAAGCVVMPVAATVVRTADATSPGCEARRRARSCLSGLNRARDCIFMWEASFGLQRPEQTMYSFLS